MSTGRMESLTLASAASRGASPLVGDQGATRRLQLLLAFANFAVGMGAFSTVGVLSPIAGALKISAAQAGFLMTIYAIVYALSSPVLVATSGRVDRAHVLVFGLTTLAAGGLLAAFAPGYAL